MGIFNSFGQYDSMQALFAQNREIYDAYFTLGKTGTYWRMCASTCTVLFRLSKLSNKLLADKTTLY